MIKIDKQNKKNYNKRRKIKVIKFTIQDYWRYGAIFPVKFELHDTEEEYELENKQKITHQYRDKIFKEILDDKKEFINFIKKYAKYEESEIKESDIEKYNRRFITTNFTAKECDIIYKIKEENIFFIIEQQSRIDYKMAERITEYCVELIRYVMRAKKITNVYPLIVPIVLYTGKKKWNAPRSLSDIQESYGGFQPLDYPRYNLVDMNDFTKEELIQEESGIAKAMLFEKIKTKEEMKETLERLLEKGLSKKEKRYLKIMLTHSNEVKKQLETKEIERYQERLNKGGKDNMSNAERLFVEVIKDWQEKNAEARQEGRQEGMQAGIIQVIKEMIKKHASDEFIMDTTKIDKKDLQKLKEELKVC